MTTTKLAQLFEHFQASITSQMTFFEIQLNHMMNSFKEFKIEMQTNMVKLSEDVNILHTQFCDNYAVENLVASTNDQICNSIKPIILFTA